MVSVRNLCAMIVFFFSNTVAVVSVVKDRQHLRIDVVSVRNLCAMIVFFFSNKQ